MHSHHSHSGEFCKHAKSTLDEVVACAAELGFTHFHLSEHSPRALPEQLYPEEVEAGLTPEGLNDQFQAYLKKARTLQKQYANAPKPMHILVGCETENIVSPQSVDYLYQVLSADGESESQLPPPAVGLGIVDYMVGSVHHAHGIPIDFDVPTFERALAHTTSASMPTNDPAPYAALLSNYLDAQHEVMDRLRPEIIGHFDLYRLFTPKAPWLPSATTPSGAALYAKLERNIRFAASYGALFEANSAAFRKGWDGETYPGKEILHMIRAAHGRIALSDDSHGVQQIALNYARLRDYLIAEGVEEIWYLERDSTPSEPRALWDAFHDAENARKVRETNPTPDAPCAFARGTRAVRLDASWRDAPFWRALPAARST